MVKTLKPWNFQLNWSKYTISIAVVWHFGRIPSNHNIPGIALCALASNCRVVRATRLQEVFQLHKICAIHHSTLRLFILQIDLLCPLSLSHTFTLFLTRTQSCSRACVPRVSNALHSLYTPTHCSPQYKTSFFFVLHPFPSHRIQTNAQRLCSTRERPYIHERLCPTDWIVCFARYFFLWCVCACSTGKLWRAKKQNQTYNTRLLVFFFVRLYRPTACDIKTENSRIEWAATILNNIFNIVCGTVW